MFLCLIIGGGYQQPASGNAYCALGTYFSGSFPNGREFLGRNLSIQLSVGVRYYVSFKINLSISSSIWVNCATNNIGVGFSTVPYHWSTNPLSVNNNPKVYSSNIITDTLNWVQIFGSFVADSAYQYIVLGNLFDDSNTDTIVIDSGTTTSCNAYYYIDDVCVSTDSSFAANYIYTGVQEEQLNDNFNIYPNPATDFFSINNAVNEPYSLTIYNSIGQLLLEETNISENSKKINIANFNSNLLFINIESNNKSINYKLLKQ